MRKLSFLTVLISVLILTLCGCGGSTAPVTRDTGYPIIRYINSQWNLDVDNMQIEVPKGHVLNQGHAYDVVATNSGYDIVLHLVPEKAG